MTKEKEEKKAAQEPYSRPQLVIYGDIRQITQTQFAQTGHQDNQGMGGQDKTN
jgi:hypothetical protein